MLAALLVLFQFDTEGSPGTAPGSIFKSRSSENRSMSPKPFASDVPPLNQTSKPWCSSAHSVWVAQ